MNVLANQKHLDLLTSGKTLRNTWRQECADVQALEPDLHEAALHGADLHGVDLTEADVQGADLRGADLDGAMLSKAILNETLWSRVDPSGANPDTFDSRETESTEERT